MNMFSNAKLRSFLVTNAFIYAFLCTQYMGCASNTPNESVDSIVPEQYLAVEPLDESRGMNLEQLLETPDNAAEASPKTSTRLFMPHESNEDSPVVDLVVRSPSVSTFCTLHAHTCICPSEPKLSSSKSANHRQAIHGPAAPEPSADSDQAPTVHLSEVPVPVLHVSVPPHLHV